MITLFWPIAFLALASLVALLSISPHLFWLQLAWFLVGFAIFFLFIYSARNRNFFDWRSFLNYRWVVWSIYGIALALLVAVFLFSPIIRQTQSRLVLGPLQFQPAEFMKVALIIVYAYFFAKHHVSIARLKNIFVTFLYFAVPAAFLAIQPDMGSAVILFGIWFGFLLVAGLKLKHIIVSAVIFLLAGLFLWNFVLHPYHKERIAGFLFPEQDQLGINYNVIQAKIAIGSAGLFGKGFGQGSQVHLGFLPEPMTDFIFSAFTEEWGMIGGLLVVAAFFFLVSQILIIGANAETNIEKFICLGTAIMFGMNFLLNIGSNLGLTPVIGVTFPFLSYGGSSLLINFILLGIIGSIAVKS